MLFLSAYLTYLENSQTKEHRVSIDKYTFYAVLRIVLVVTAVMYAYTRPRPWAKPRYLFLEGLTAFLFPGLFLLGHAALT